MMRLAIITGAALTIVSASPVGAQDKAAPDNLYIDFAVPDLPALAALGLNPSKVQRPGTLKELSVAAFPLVDSESTIGPGVALAWAPVYTFAKDIDGYRKPVLRRLAFSLVTSKEGKTDAVNAGAGIRIMLFDRTDVLLSSKKGALCTDAERAKDYECQVIKILASEDGPTSRNNAFAKEEVQPVLVKVADLVASGNAKLAGNIIAGLMDTWDLRKVPTPFTTRGLRTAFDKSLDTVAKANTVTFPKLPESLSDEVDILVGKYLALSVISASTISPRLAKLREGTEEERWNWAVASIDVGIVGQSPTGSWSDLEGKAYGGLLSVAFPVGSRGQLIAQLEARNGVGDDATERSHVGGGGRLLVGNSSKRFSLEGYVADTDERDETKNGKSYRYTVGAEFRVTKGFWLEVAFGTDHTPASTGTRLLSLANFKYAFKSSPRFTQIPGSVDD